MVWGAAARAQGPVDGAVWGRVVDEHGAAMGKMHVEVCAAEGAGRDGGAREGSVERTIETDGDGSFVVLKVPPGEYVVRASLPQGGEVLGERLVEVEVGETADVTLRVAHPGLTLGRGGGGAAELTHGAGTGLAQGVERVSPVEESASMEEQFAALPVEAREWEGLAVVDSRVNVAGADAGRAGEQDDDGNDGGGGVAGGGLSFGGLAAVENGASVDGVATGQSFGGGAGGGGGSRVGSRGGGRVGASFGEGAVRSFRVLPRTFSAQYGGAAGGLFAVVSRGGAEGLHGSAFYLARGAAWGAANPFSVETHYRDGVVTSGVVKPGGWLQGFGGAVGLPLNGASVPARVRGRVSVFGSLEEQVRADRVVSTPALASFYTLSAGQVALLGNRGVTKAATNAALDYLDSLSGETARLATRELGFARVDFMQSESDRVMVSYVRNRFDAPKGAAGGAGVSEAVVARGTGSLGDSVVRIDAGTGRWLHTFDASANNDLRGQVAHDLEFETPHAPLPQEPGIGPGGFAPQVTIETGVSGAAGFAYGTPANLGKTAYPEEWRFSLAEALQVRVGRHLVTAGGDWSRVHDRVAAVTNEEGSFSYDSGTTNGKDGGLVDWITDYTFNVHAYPNGGCPSIVAAVHYFCFRSFTQSFAGAGNDASTEFATHELAGFAEDAFRLRKDLLVTLGARYDYTLLPLPQTPNRVLDADLAGLALPVTGATNVFPEDRNNAGVRFGAAWSPGSWTVRLGYGVFYGRVPGATVRAALAETALPTTVTRIRIRPTTITACPQVQQVTGMQGFGYPCAFVTTPPAAVTQTTSAVVFSGRYRAPAVQRAGLSVERDVGRRVFLRASYAMAVATQLPQSVDVNLAPATAMGSFVLQGGSGYAGLRAGETFVVPMYTARRIAQYGPVTALVSSANATYHAATMEARWRGAGVELRGSYTFSRAIDYGAQGSATPRQNGQFDPFRDGYDKGLSSLQFPQRFAGDAVYAVRLKRGAAWVRRGLDGWRVGAIATAGSGAPYSYEIFGGPYLSGGHESINGSGGATYLPTIGRNTLRLPARGNVDVRLGRAFSLGKGMKLEGFAEAFNVLNSQSLSRVETRAFLVGSPVAGGATPLVFQDAATIAAEGLTTPAFGTPLSSTNGLSRERQVELGVRLRF